MKINYYWIFFVNSIINAASYSSTSSFSFKLIVDNETTEIITLRNKDLKRTYRLDSCGLKSIHESYECILPKRFGLGKARIIANRYGEKNKLQCYFISENDNTIILLPTRYFYAMRKAAILNDKARHTTREILDKIFQSYSAQTPLLQLPEKQKIPLLRMDRL